MNKEKRRVPKLRFPGFTEDWEQRKLIDTAKTFIGLVTTMTENYRDSGTLLIRNSDIKEGQFVFSEKPIHLDEEFAEKNKTRRLQIGDVVTVHTGDIGTSAVIQEKEAGAIGFATINTRTDKRILNPYFLSTYFNTEKHKCYANSVSTGDGRSNYNIKDFNKLVISIPTLDEQEKISALINNINTIITLHQRKLEYLNLKKKALLQKLFPKNGERYPELRFPGFTDAWEQCKLSEVVTINPKTELPDEFKYVDLESVVGTNLLGFQVIKKGNAPSRAQRLASYGDVFYQTVRPYQRNNYLFENIDKDMVFSTGYAQLRSKLDSYFLLTLVQNDNFVKVVLDNCTGTSYPAINGSELGKITVQIPSNDAEANQIGKVFRGIDNIITLHQRKLEHLQLQKKALLQQMFV